MKMKVGAGTLVLVVAHSAVGWAQTTPDTMPANSWLSIPNTKMRAVAPQSPSDFPGTWGIVGPNSVITAWGGAALDSARNRLVLFGGGHGDYYGNELYAFDVGTLKWSRLTDPTINPTFTSDVNWDGTPPSRHSYGGLAYIADVDRYFATAGGLSSINGIWSSDKTWTFDFASKIWTNRNPTPKAPNGGFGCNCSYDPETRKVWYGSAASSFDGLWSYDYNANAWTKHNSDDFYEFTSTVDTKRGLLVVVGKGNVFAYDIRTANFTRQNWTTTGGDALVSKSAPGVDYDPVSDRIVAWHGGSVYALNPDTKVWASYSPPGAPATTGNGIYGRWRYVPSVNAFIVVTPDWDADVRFFKLTAGGGGGPPPDTTPPTVTITTPTSNPTATATGTPLVLGGTASDNAGINTITWNNALTGGSGTTTGTATWTASVALAAGSNVITVTARDAAGNAGTDAVAVTYTPPGGDTDSDGLPDAWEQQYFGGLGETAGGDPDGDGLTNQQELAAGTNPTLADTDGDGSDDLAEVNAGSNPLDPLSVPLGGGGGGGRGGGGCGACGLEALLLGAILRRRRRP